MSERDGFRIDGILRTDDSYLIFRESGGAWFSSPYVGREPYIGKVNSSDPGKSNRGFYFGGSYESSWQDVVPNTSSKEVFPGNR